MRLAAIVLAASTVVAGCGDDDEVVIPDPEPVGSTTTTAPPFTGELVVPTLDGTFPVAVPSLGFGVAVPQGWQATLLSETALERLEGATLDDPTFLDAARTIAESGAIFYAAGADGIGRVGELKIDVQVEADTSPAGVRAMAESVESSAGVDDAAIDEDLPDGRIRVDFVAQQETAEGRGTVQTLGSQLFVPAGDRLWSLIVTSEDADTHAALVALFSGSFVTAEPVSPESR